MLNSNAINELFDKLPSKRKYSRIKVNKKMNIPTLKRDLKISSMFAKRIKRTWIEE